MKLIKLDSSDMKALDNIAKTHPPNRFVYPAFGVSFLLSLLSVSQLLILCSRSILVSPISSRLCKAFDEPDDDVEEEMSLASYEGYSGNHTMIARMNLQPCLQAMSPLFLQSRRMLRMDPMPSAMCCASFISSPLPTLLPRLL
jgi:hypothetical protein